MSLKLSDYEREMFYPNTELLDLEYQKRKDEDGVSIDISNDEFLGILTYTKNHYDEAVSFFREIGDNKDVFHYFLNFSNPIFRPKGLQRIRFYKFMLDHFAIMSYLKGYTTGFKMVEHMDSYHDVMMQIFGYLNDASADDRKEYFDRAISNIEELKKLGISDVKMAIGYPKNSEFRMDYYTEEERNGYPLHWKFIGSRENFYTDGTVQSFFDQDKNCVLVQVVDNDFLIKTWSGTDLENNTVVPYTAARAILYDLDFDSYLLPSRQQIMTGECQLDSYQNLVDKKQNPSIRLVKE